MSVKVFPGQNKKLRNDYFAKLLPLLLPLFS
jgi:hypothetical protein